MFSDWLRRIVGKIFAKLPPEPIWEWAEKNVFISGKHGAESDFYRSKKTPWTRWIQEIPRNPWRMRNGKRVRIRRVRIKKCTQSGVTESVLNVIRWFAKHAPRNFIYAINSKEEALNIRERLVDTLAKLGEDIFDGDVDDLADYVLRLREMVGWFLGSHSMGAFANKFAPLVIGDELDDHAHVEGNSDTLSLLDERCKTADDEDLSFAIGKPKLSGGPIDKAHSFGDQFEWMVPCPHCETYQLISLERLRFKHCRDLLGGWDREGVLNETYYECVCGCRIENGHKPWMQERGRWWLVKFGDPETVSLTVSDFHSMNASSTFGIMASEFIDATEAAKRGNLSKLQAFWNGRLGLGFEQRVERFHIGDLYKCRRAYRRGIVPHKGLILVEGMDVGLFVNTKWVVMALHPATTEAWVIDWGVAREPRDLLDHMRDKRYECIASGRHQGIAFSFIDCRYLREKVFATCLAKPKQIRPTLGIGVGNSARSIGFTPVPQTPDNFGVITFIDADAKTELYTDRIKNQRVPGIWFPEDADDEFLQEWANERMIVDPVTSSREWAKKPAGPNHWGDAGKIVILGYDYLIDGPRTRATGQRSEIKAVEASTELDIAALTSAGPAPAA